MSNITELAQREKFEAWWERTQHNGNPPRFGWERWRDGEGYKVDDDESELDGIWEAWKAAGAELEKALEKAQQMEAYWKTQCCGITDHCEELQARIADLELRHRQRDRDDFIRGITHPASMYTADEAMEAIAEYDRTH